MSLIKEYSTYSNRPIRADELIDKLHLDYTCVNRNIQKNCPSCKSEEYNFAFKKYSFHYVECCECKSIYVQNNLDENEILKYEEYLDKNLYSTNEYQSYLDLLSHKISFELELTFSRLFDKKERIPSGNSFNISSIDPI